MTHKDSTEVRLNVKFVSDSESPGQQFQLDQIEHIKGVRHAEPLFPGESHPDLASIFTVELEGEDPGQAVSDLQQLPDVDYVEAPADRKLVLRAPDTALEPANPLDDEPVEPPG